MEAHAQLRALRDVLERLDRLRLATACGGRGEQGDCENEPEPHRFAFSFFDSRTSSTKEDATFLGPVATLMRSTTWSLRS
jgi:hypothetical protein